MHLNKYQRLAMRTKGQYQSEQDRFCCALAGLQGELGELVESYKKHYWQGHDYPDFDKSLEEFGDFLWYVALLADSLGISMSDAAFWNIRKLKFRYPEKFTTERSINREE